MVRPSGAVARDDAMCDGAELDPLPVEPQLELPRDESRRSRAARDPVAELEGRDLGEVEDVANVDAVAGELDARVVVDREVAERVGARRAREREHEPDRGDERCDGLAKHGELLSRVRPRHVFARDRASGSAGGAGSPADPVHRDGGA